jgi:23S rRNA pseudouridine1911/1915/1917 synthase
MDRPFSLTVVHEDPEFLVVDKPPRLPTVPLKNDPAEKQTLLSLVSERYPEVRDACGQNAWEGGVLHRLDTATSGLVVIARSKETYTFLKQVQKADLFWKEYLAVSSGPAGLPGKGFPPFPYDDPATCGGKEVAIGSLFRGYGSNRREVRPVLMDSSPRLLEKTSGTWYVTQVCYTGIDRSGGNRFSCRLSSGFRHQVRVHLAWSGWPLEGDELYGGVAADQLALRAVAVRFLHPKTQRQVEIRIQ